MTFRVQAIFTARCNLYNYRTQSPYGKSCPYCSMYSNRAVDGYYLFNGVSKPVERELKPEEWIAGAHRIINAVKQPILFDLTGGEPTLYPGLPKVLSALKDMSAWAITSNSLLTKQIETLFKADINPPYVWTASFHPGANYPIDDFLSNLDFIRSHGCPVTVTTVLHSSTKHRIKQDMQAIRERGYQAQIHLYLDKDYSLADDEQEMRDLFAELQSVNFSPNERWDDSPPGPRDCSAGQASCTVVSDGKVYLCYEHALLEDSPPVGRWGEWIPSSSAVKGCNWTCRFPCDKQLILAA